jgi:predicted SprT family Zn-dependent metalloprotease
MLSGLQPGPSLWWRESVATWLTLWGVPELERHLTISVSTRLRTSLARCFLARSEIRIASFLVAAPEPLVREVLCHEAAHAAVVALHGRRVRPHGVEWRGLMSVAGFEPRARLREDSLALPIRSRRARVLWEHRCPVCQARRLAGRPVKQWRCAACCEVGLPGRLLIQRATSSIGSVG